MIDIWVEGTEYRYNSWCATPSGSEWSRCEKSRVGKRKTDWRLPPGKLGLNEPRTKNVIHDKYRVVKKRNTNASASKPARQSQETEKWAPRARAWTHDVGHEATDIQENCAIRNRAFHDDRNNTNTTDPNYYHEDASSWFDVSGCFRLKKCRLRILYISQRMLLGYPISKVLNGTRCSQDGKIRVNSAMTLLTIVCAALKSCMKKIWIAASGKLFARTSTVRFIRTDLDPILNLQMRKFLYFIAWFEIKEIGPESGILRT